MLAIQTAALERYPLEQMLKVCSEVGIGAVELHSCHLPQITPMLAQAVKRVVENHGIEVSGYVWNHRGVKPWWEPVGFSPFTRKGYEQSVQCIRDNLEIAKSLEVPYMTLFETSKKDDTPDDEAWNNMVRVFQAGTEIAEDMGIKLYNEFHPGMYASTEEGAVKLVDEINSPYFKACFDFCHAYVMTNGLPTRLIKNLGQRIGHVHLASTDGVPHIHMPLGTGLVDTEKCFVALSEIGYKGPWSLCQYGYPCPEEGIVTSLNFIRKINVDL